MSQSTEKMIKIKSEHESNIILKMYQSQNSETCVIYIHGFSGTYDALAKSIKECVNNENIAFVFPYFNCEGLEGAKFENYDYAVSDIECVYNYIKTIFKRIIIIGHSLGCNKALLFMNEKPQCIFNKLILLAPQDLSECAKLSIHKGMQEEAILNIKNGNPEKILQGKFLEFAKISSASFNKLANLKFLHNTSYKHNNVNYVKDIKIPTYIAIGENDPGLDCNQNISAEQLMENLIQNNKLVSFNIIKDAKHTFKSHYDELKKLIVGFLI